ncbi:MAG: hypothetical protein WC459_02915 [Patescibacteria group bacterium]
MGEKLKHHPDMARFLSPAEVLFEKLPSHLKVTANEIIGMAINRMAEKCRKLEHGLRIELKFEVKGIMEITEEEWEIFYSCLCTAAIENHWKEMSVSRKNGLIGLVFEYSLW